MRLMMVSKCPACSPGISLYALPLSGSMMLLGGNLYRKAQAQGLEHSR